MSLNQHKYFAFTLSKTNKCHMICTPFSKDNFGEQIVEGDDNDAESVWRSLQQFRKGKIDSPTKGIVADTVRSG